MSKKLPPKKPSRPDPDASIFMEEKPFLELPRRILHTILNQPVQKEKMTIEALAEEIGLNDTRFKSILYSDSNGLKKISLSDITKIVVHTRRLAQRLSDQGTCSYIIGYCNQLAELFQDRLEQGGLSPTQNALVTNLRLNDQQAFSDRHAGVYALIRLDRDAHILISRIDVYPRDILLCKFATDRRVTGLIEPPVEGYIFSIGDEIQAIGRPRTTSALRTSVLRGYPNTPTGRDMIGLRLGISDLDGGPFAYRTYCRWIAGTDQLDRDMPEWADLFRGRKHEASDKIALKINDISEILRLLHEEDEKHKTPWGVGIPTGIGTDEPQS